MKNEIHALDKNYALGRKNKLSWKYRVKRRTLEIIQAIHKYSSLEINSILDIGAAEGLMLSVVKKEFPQAKCIGVEYSQELININKDKSIEIIQGDAQNLPLKDNSFNVAIATAVIEHLSEPFKLLTEAHRVLKKDGILILTTANPFFDKIAHLIGRGDPTHQKTFGLKELKKMFQKANFQVLSTEGFMMSPCGFPGELKIEKLIKLFKLEFILLNQLIIGKK